MPEDATVVEVAIEEVTKVLANLVNARDDLVILTAYMADQDYSAKDIAYAVEKPYKFEDVMVEARADLDRQMAESEVLQSFAQEQSSDVGLRVVEDGS